MKWMVAALGAVSVAGCFDATRESGSDSPTLDGGALEETNGRPVNSSTPTCTQVLVDWGDRSARSHRLLDEVPRVTVHPCGTPERLLPRGCGTGDSRRLVFEHHYESVGRYEVEVRTTAHWFSDPLEDQAPSVAFGRHRVAMQTKSTNRVIMFSLLLQPAAVGSLIVVLALGCESVRVEMSDTDIGRLDATAAVDASSARAVDSSVTADSSLDDVDLSGYDCIRERSSLVHASGLNPRDDVDYVELRRMDVVLGAWGERCASAADQEACQASYLEPTPLDDGGLPCAGLCVGPFLVVNIGSEHFRLGTTASIASVLDTIDTPEEASLLLWSAGYGWSAECIRKDQGAIIADEDGYRAIVMKRVSECPVRVERHLVDISPGGQMTVRAIDVVEMRDECPPPPT